MTTIKLGEKGDAYPGDRLVQVKTRDFCSDSVGAWLGYPVNYDVGFTWFHEAGVEGRQPALGLLGEDRPVSRVSGVLALADPAPWPPSPAAPTTAASATEPHPASGSPASADRTATPDPGDRPRGPERACFRLTYDQAIAPDRRGRTAAASRTRR